MSHFSSASNLTVGNKTYKYFSMADLEVQKLPYSLKILLENMLRTKDGANVTQAHVDALVSWDPNKEPDTEIQFSPARVIMQDFTGVPCIVDLATMREAVQELGGDPQSINPLTPAEMVIDHSVVADVSGSPDAAERMSNLNTSETVSGTSFCVGARLRSITLKSCRQEQALFTR